MAEPQRPPTPPSLQALATAVASMLLIGLLDPPMRLSILIAAAVVFVVAYGVVRLTTPPSRR